MRVCGTNLPPESVTVAQVADDYKTIHAMGGVTGSIVENGSAYSEQYTLIRDSIYLATIPLRPAPARLARAHVAAKRGIHMTEEFLRAERVPGAAVAAHPVQRLIVEATL
jgi:hypothetical protein